MKNWIRFIISIIAITLSLTLVACQEKGPAQEAGEAIDEAVEDTKEAIEDAVNPKGPAEKAGEKIDDAVEETKEKTREITN
ncbi:hypothetical protein [Geoalkalibacter halelectricus]|uniref:Lipoprotein n=1 Tax=Geoalkalibacter halelectricus TaxID=2847045 RepID=A0ABY5ZLW0_9BACT|nr:hypothetical protein [Geoalkalibacter halelectricus]MDO3378990.1 hypothetical protein [Geoalkalibacter halelectricus]UWZ78805.1 hypothetical protein L9S41_14115 [Geoalkalibacter halelectricus]